MRARDGGTLTCPVCQQIFTKHNLLAFHYEAMHAICDPNLTTVQSFPCSKCLQTFRRAGDFKTHRCPAAVFLPRFSQVDDEAQVPGPDTSLTPPLPQSWHIYTDGSGGSSGSAEVPQQAGWGVAVFDVENPDMTTTWRAALYGPVNITPYDPIWLGARVHSNNTGEVSAIGEACRYLLRIHQQLPQDHPRRATIYYDSTYTYGVVTRLTKGRENTELIDTVASLLEATRRIFQVDFKHVRAHTDIYGNEAADRLAGRGRRVGFHRMQLHGLNISQALWEYPLPPSPPKTPSTRYATPCGCSGSSTRPLAAFGM